MKKFQILRYLKRFRVLILLVALLGSAATYIYTELYMSVGTTAG